MAPMRLRLGVPITRAAISAHKPSAGMFINTASRGAATISGSPVVIQWAVTLAITMTSSATGCNASSSRLPSS